MALPVLYARGVWTAKLPYVVAGNTSYICVAIDAYRDLESGGVNVLQKYYLDRGLSADDYNLDNMNAGAIIKLVADNMPTLEIPNSYITGFPTGVDEGYARLIIGLDIGIFPTYFDLDYLLLDLKEAVKANTGLDAEPTLNFASYTGVITPEQAQAFEANRKAAIATRTTYFSRIKQLEQQIEALKATNAHYESLLTGG